MKEDASQENQINTLQKKKIVRHGVRLFFKSSKGTIAAKTV